jgi:hypothetical protein
MAEQRYKAGVDRVKNKDLKHRKSLLGHTTTKDKGVYELSCANKTNLFLCLV